MACRRFSPIFFAMLVAILGGHAALADEPPAGAEANRLARLTVPEGFTVEIAAGPPLVERPITIDFDEQGRLYVSDSSGSSDPVQKQLEERPHRILRLEDTDGDGRFDRRTVFADQMMFPEGTMWFRGSLYVSAPPTIWKLTDTNDDGVADRREAWFNGKTLTGCANDLHGPYRGRDGWIYWCKGAFAEQTYDLPGRPGWKTRASHIFRARPDGSGLEPVMTGGMDNPVDLVFSAEGERFLSSTFLQFRGDGKRDGIIHAIYGGVYGKQNDVLNGHQQTGELMPILVHLGPAAASGLHHYESTSFGDAYQGDLFACSFNLRKVTRHKLVPAGSSYTTEDSDFLVSESFDFHPTDVMEDADGSLLVCDTGGWYTLCCPTSQFNKPNVLGTIYRIRREGAAKIEDPRGRKIDWKNLDPPALTPLLADSRPAVRERAIEALAGLEHQSLAALAELLKTSESVTARLNAVWTLSRIDDPAARQLVVRTLGDPSARVRHAAAHVAGVWRDRQASGRLQKCLTDSSPAVARAAAEAIGRLSDPTAVEYLLQASQRADERALQHSLIYAMIEIGDAAAIRPGLSASDPRTRLAALIALSQLPNSPLAANDVLPLLSATDMPLREAAWWVALREPKWGEQLSEHLLARLRSLKGESDRDELLAALSRLSESAAIQSLIAKAVDDVSLPIGARSLALSAMAQSRAAVVPDAWLDPVLRSLGTPDLVAEALAALQSLGLSKAQRERLRPALVGLAGRAEQPLAERLAELEALRDAVGALAPPLFELVKVALTADGPPLERASAANVLAGAKLDTAQQLEVAGLLAGLPPLELTRLLPVFFTASPDAQQQALEALAASDGLAGIRRDVLNAFIVKLADSLRPQGEAVLSKVDAQAAGRRERLEQLYTSLPPGDVQRGHAVFNSKKAACVVCHTVAYVGGQIGPDLSKIGQIRTDRDLLEAIVYPSASFVRSFEPVLVVTQSGQQFSGLVKQESPSEIVLTTGPTTTERIAREEIDEVRPSQTSLMPEGLEKLLAVQDVADLIAYLKSRR